MGSHLDATLEALKQNGWKKPENNSHGPSNLLLFREYLRHMMWWSFMMERGFIWMTDLAEEFYPDIRLTEDFHNQIRDTLVIFPHTQLLYHNALEWAHLEDHVDLANQYQGTYRGNPYEPLLWMFRRGGAMHYKDDAYVEFWSGAVEFWSGEKLWYVKSEYWIFDYQDGIPLGEPALELNDAALDAIDAEASKKDQSSL